MEGLVVPNPTPLRAHSLSFPLRRLFAGALMGQIQSSSERRSLKDVQRTFPNLRSLRTNPQLGRLYDREKFVGA